jgi:serine/threonine-protein kinase
LSPDGRRIALWLEGDTVNIWTYDLARDALTRLTFSPDDHNPVWSPDGKQVAFESSRSGTHHIYVQPADGTGSATQITAGDYDDYVGDWSPDGHYLVFSEWNPQTGFDLWTVGTGGQSPPKPFATTAFTEKQASFSSDGRWLAYVSDESGQNEVYVQPFLGPGAKRQVSTGGGEEPAWARSGRELFYRLGGRMMAVTVHENGEFTADRPRLLFEGLFHYTATPSRTYDVAPDGRFLMVAEPEAAYAARQINVVLNWAGQPAQSLR